MSVLSVCVTCKVPSLLLTAPHRNTWSLYRHKVPSNDIDPISDPIGRFIPSSVTLAQREQLRVVLAFGLFYDRHPPATSGSSITKKSSFHRPSLQSDSLDYLWVSGYQVDGLITPPDLLTLDIKYDAFDGTLGAKSNRFAIPSRHDFQPQVFYVGEMDILEWLWPDSIPARQLAAKRRLQGPPRLPHATGRDKLTSWNAAPIQRGPAHRVNAR